MKKRLFRSALLAAASLSLAWADGDKGANVAIQDDTTAIFKQIFEIRGAKGDAPNKSAVVPITYHGGPVMLGTVKVYYIWYGSWSGNTAVQILTDLASSIGGSPYFNINTTYYQGSVSKLYVSNSVAYGGSTTDNYSRGKSLSDSAIRSVVSDAITSKRLPTDANGVYFVLTSSDVTATSGFCSQYCGWHTYSTIANTGIKFAFVGNPERCPNSCSMLQAPNGNLGADGMASIISHELEESTTDPALNAWWDSKGQENADKCAWTFGATYTAPSGAIANMKLNTSKSNRDWLIQQNWVNTGAGFCAKSY